MRTLSRPHRLACRLFEAVMSSWSLHGVNAGGWNDLGDAVGSHHDAPFAAVGEVVVDNAEEAPVGQVSLAARRPRDDVVRFCPRRWPIAPGPDAPPVASARASFW